MEFPYTLFAFWLGVTSSPALKVGVKISPAGRDTKGLGDTKPAVLNTTPEGRAQNRRVEIVKQ